MRLRSYVIASIVISVILHFILLQATERVRFERPAGEVLLPVSTVLSTIDRTKLEQQRKTQPEDSVFASRETLEQLNEHNLQPDEFSPSEEAVRDILEKAQLISPPKMEYVLDGISREQDNALNTEELSMAATAPRPKIIEIVKDTLPAERQNLSSRALTPEVERFDIPQFDLPSLAAPGPLTAATDGTYGLSVKTGSRPQFSLPDSDFQYGDPDGPSFRTGLPAPLALPTELGEIQELHHRDVEELPKPFDEYVDLEVLVLRDKVGSGGYFQVNISPNRASDNLADIAKDSLFVIDHSASISHAKLVQFKKGTQESLQYLNPGDRFNIVSFTSRPRSLFDTFTPNNPATRKQAEAYVDGLVRGGMTDVFSSIAPYVSKGNGMPQRPVNIFLMTDGQSTVNIHESDFILRQIYGRNPGNVSIFPFSAGKQANRELLDFLGYLNRGAKCHVDNVDNLSSQLVDFVNSHSSLIIADLRYTVDRETGREIFPRTLPHLYRHETLRLYGRFRNISDELVINLTGRDASMAKRDLVFRCRYADCKEAPESLAQEWAGQKILYLIAVKTWSSDEAERKAYDQQIKQLTQTYQVYTPY